MSAFQFGMTLGGIVVLAYFTLWVVAITVRLLGERNLFWTIVTEPTGKAIMVNGVVAYLLMNMMGRRYQGSSALTAPTVDADEQWEIVPEPDQSHLHLAPTGLARFLPSFKNIRWIGLPPSVDAYQYRFTWNSFEETRDPQGNAVGIKLKPSDKVIDYILLEEDVYAFRHKGFECKDKIPLDTSILIGGYITNPYKALFKVERWLEASNNLVGVSMRDFFGQKSYEELVSMSQVTARMAAPAPGTPPAAPSEMETFFAPVVQEIHDKWGFKITFIRYYGPDPGSDLAAEFIRATTQVYVATQKADAEVQNGRGLAARDKAHFEAITGVPGGVEMFKWQRIGESNLTTYVEGGGVQVALPVGGQGTTPNRQAQPQGGNPPATPPATPPTTGPNP